MAFHLPFSISNGEFLRLRRHAPISSRSIRVRGRRFQACCSKSIVRRSANYQPPVWEFDYIQSLNSPYQGEAYNVVAKELKEGAKIILLHKVGDDPLLQLELIDTLERLGLAYTFQDQIKMILKNIHYHFDHWRQDDLYSKALGFRLLRQYGYNVSADIFNIFKDKNGNFNGDDIMGMLHLYEASYLLFEGEGILEDARRCATKHLREYDHQIGRDFNDSYISSLVSHALDLPLHWRITRSEARWFIKAYETKQDMNPLLLVLAKFDFNLVQATHQDDLRYSSNWWRSTGLGEKLRFARNRLMENFLWTIGIIFEPELGYCRRSLAKVNSFITTIDDVYDVYGTFEELQLFTNAVERWDINEVEKLPDYMKVCFSTLFNTANEFALQVLKDRGVSIISNLKNSWAELCKCYLLEAKWYYNGYMPTMEEYIENAHISISAPLILVHLYFWTNNNQTSTKEALRCLEEYPDMIRCQATIFRLVDDLGTSSDEIKRGDVPKSIQCYMHETGATEEDSRAEMRKLVDEEWKRLNYEAYNCNKKSPFSDDFKKIVMNLTRIAMLMYRNGDGHASQSQESIDHVLSLLIHPIPFEGNEYYVNRHVPRATLT